MTKASHQSLIKPFMALFCDAWHAHFITRTHLLDEPFAIGLPVILLTKASFPSFEDNAVADDLAARVGSERVSQLCRL